MSANETDTRDAVFELIADVVVEALLYALARLIVAGVVADRAPDDGAAKEWIRPVDTEVTLTNAGRQPALNRSLRLQADDRSIGPLPFHTIQPDSARTVPLPP